MLWRDVTAYMLKWPNKRRSRTWTPWKYTSTVSGRFRFFNCFIGSRVVIASALIKSQRRAHRADDSRFQSFFCFSAFSLNFVVQPYLLAACIKRIDKQVMRMRAWTFFFPITFSADIIGIIIIIIINTIIILAFPISSKKRCN